MSHNEYLFVYGTLAPEKAPPEISNAVAKLRRVGAGRVKGHLYDLGDYPGAILDGPLPSLIPGQIFQLPDDMHVLESLDEYEDFKPADPDESLFVRVKSPVHLADGRQLDCWVYVYNRDPVGHRRLI